MKVLFRNIFGLLTVILLFVALAACKTSTTTTTKSSTTATTHPIDSNTNTTGGTNVTATTELTTLPTNTTADTGSTEQTTATTGTTGINLNGKTIRILHGAPNEIDPTRDDYSGDFKDEKKQMHLAVEAKYNCSIVYELYPDNAPWGPDRANAIVQSELSGSPMGEIYAISSMWIGTLVQGQAIAPVKSYIRNIANVNYDPNMLAFGTYMDNVYGFESGFVFNDASGLYYNMDLLNSLGLDDPAEKWNAGEWTWDDFTAYVNAAQVALASKGADYYALGGVPAVWAMNMVPNNGGYLINPSTHKVAFDQSASLQTFTYLSSLYNSGAWESDGQFDAGSALWSSGKILFHPGELWFLNAPNRFGLLEFPLGYVPYPLGNGKTIDDYRIGRDSAALYAISSSYNDPNGLNAEVLFRIWNELQYWQTYDEALLNFQFTLEERYDNLASIDAHLSVLDKIYLEQIANLGISGFDTNLGFYIIFNKAIKENDPMTYLSAIKPAYQDALDTMFPNG